MAENTITWEEKVEMIGYHNRDEWDKFKDFVKKNIARFDEQAVMMFLDCIEFGNTDVHEFLYEIHDELQTIADTCDVGLRSGMRLAAALDPNQYFKTEKKGKITMGKYDLTDAIPYNEQPLYKKGYEDALDDFCEWLEKNYEHFDGKVEDFVADFRKAMEK